MTRSPPRERKRSKSWINGAIRALISTARGTLGSDDDTDEFFLPDFCAAKTVLAVVLVSELLAVSLSLARSPDNPFLTELARVSMFVQWLGLTGAAVLCYTRRWLMPLPVGATTLIVFGLLSANTALLSALTVWVGRYWQAQGVYGPLFPEDVWPFVWRNLAICLIVVALLLRYFFVSQQWRHHVRAEARARIHALQARIRPHFLFNSMNTIAALTRSDPVRAEEAVEDLADLFRATLKDSDAPLRLKEELELSRIYQRIEMLRLGDRLSVDWQIADLPMRALVPGLILQPLLENAIYHGIEPLDGGGLIEVRGRFDGVTIELVVTNPVAPNRPLTNRPGNRLALDNIDERLRLAYGDAASLTARERDGRYTVSLRFPFRQ